MTDTAWKAFERRMAIIFGGKRRGSDFRGEHGGKSDIIKPGWSIECKLLSRPGFQDLLNACDQAERNTEHPDDIPVAVVKRKGDNDNDTLVVMRLESFSQFFINEEKQGCQDAP